MIFLTGGTGLIGSHILFDIASSGKKVRAMRRKDSMVAVSRLFSSSPEYINNVEWVEGNVCDLFSLEEALEGVSVVYHTAALISFYGSERKQMMKTNVEGTSNMVNMSLKKGIERFCFISSVAALGRTREDQIIDENSWWKTSSRNSNYAISKYGGEREVWRGMEEGLSAFIINPTIVIGPGNWNRGSSQMFSQVWKGLSFYATGMTGFVDVRDVSKTAINLMEKGVSNERFIINAENVSYKMVFDLIAESLGRPKSRIKVTPLLSEIGWRLEGIRSRIMREKPLITKETARNSLMRWQYSNEKIKNETGIEFISIEQSVKDTCDIFLKEMNGN